MMEACLFISSFYLCLCIEVGKRQEGYKILCGVVTLDRRLQQLLHLWRTSREEGPCLSIGTQDSLREGETSNLEGLHWHVARINNSSLGRAFGGCKNITSKNVWMPCHGGVDSEGLIVLGRLGLGCSSKGDQ